MPVFRMKNRQAYIKEEIKSQKEIQKQIRDIKTTLSNTGRCKNGVVKIKTNILYQQRCDTKQKDSINAQNRSPEQPYGTSRPALCYNTAAIVSWKIPPLSHGKFPDTLDKKEAENRHV
ncbi:MAG: hypothetical protein ACRC5U_02295 [Plesiomonas sp.]